MIIILIYLNLYQSGSHETRLSYPFSLYSLYCLRQLIYYAAGSGRGSK